MLKERLQECVKTRSPITNIINLKDNSIAFSTRLHGVKIFSPLDCSVSKNLAHELLGHKTTASAFSHEHTLLAFANATTIYVLDLLTKLIIQTIKTDDGEIEALAFAPNSSYLIAGTKDGRVCQYRYDTKSQISRLCSFPYKRERLKRIHNNYVSAIAFFGHYAACSGYGGTITLIKMNSLWDKRVIEASNVRIDALCFVDNARLLSGSADGVLRIHHLQKEEKTQSVNIPVGKIKKILKMPNRDYVMVSANSNKLIIVDLVIAKVVSWEYLSFESEIVDIFLDTQERLFIALQNNILYKFQLPHVDELKAHIANNALDEAFKLIEADPMLQRTREHKRVEVLYDKLCAGAIESLVHGQIKEVQKLLAIFSSVQSKQDEVQAIFKDFKHYSRFKMLVSEKKYALAYAMSEKFASLKKTVQFKRMEESFKDAFGFAQKQILMQREDIARELLSPYVTVPAKKPIITLLLKQNRDFIEFLRAIQTKNYQVIEKLLGKNELFSQIPTYLALRASEEETLAKIKEHIDQNRADKAIEQIISLEHATSYKKELKELYRAAKILQLLNEKYAKADISACYEIIDKEPLLSEVDISARLENEWAKLMRECEVFALNGDIKSIKERLGILIAIPTRRAKVGDLLRVSFHSKIKALLAKKSYLNAENIIYSYIDIFGLDSEIFTLARICEKLARKKLAFTHDEANVVPRDNWIRSPLIITPSNLK